MLNESGVMKMPKQELGEGKEGETGYIGEDTGEVETFEAPEGGSSNAVPDLATAEARVKAAELNLEREERVLAQAKEADSKRKKTAAKTPAEKPVVGTAKTPSEWETSGGTKGTPPA